MRRAARALLTGARRRPPRPRPLPQVWDNAANPKNANLGGIADGPLCTYLSRDYLASAAPLPLRSAVHVETVVGQDGSFPIDSVAESRFVAAQAKELAAAGVRVGIVPFVALAAPDAAAALDAHAAALGSAFKGVRMILNHDAQDASLTWPQVPHGDFLAPPGTPAADAFAAGFALLAPRGLSFDLHANPAQLAGAAAFLARAPPTRVVLDHLGCPKLGTGDAARDAATLAAWKAGMRALAALPLVSVKLSGLEYVRAGWTAAGSAAAAEVRDCVLWVLREFGAARVMAASNFPVDLHMSPTRAQMPELYAALHALLAPELDEEQLQAVFAGNAERFYRV